MKRLTIAVTVLVGMLAIALGVVTLTGPAGATGPAGVIDSGTRSPLRLYSTPDILAAQVAVDASSNTGNVDVQRLTLTVADGDLLSIVASLEVSDTPMVAPRYTAGVGYHVWAERTGQPGTRVRISPYTGLNILEPMPHGHYAQLDNHSAWIVPDGWSGSVTVTAVVDAASTAFRVPNDALDIRDGYCMFQIEVWR